MASNNGKLKANRRAAMRGYRAGIRSSGLWLQDADHPIFLTYQEIDRMMLDEQVYLGYEMLYAPICTVKVQCQCKDERVKKFVERQFHRFWLHDLFKAFRMVVYGHAGGEIVLEQMGKYLEFASFVEAHPQDVAPLIHEKTGGLWGVRVSGSGMPKPAFLKSPYSVWFINEQQFSSWYGRTRLKAVWYAWNEKRGGGAKSASGARKLWFVKNAFDGGMLWYPSRDTFQDPDTGEMINAQDFAMKILEQKETGGVLGLPSDVDETGNKKWSYEPPKVNGQIDGVLDWGDKLDLAILKGWGIPPEVIQASGEPGGGFAGRALPALMFYKREDGLVDSIVYPFDKQVVRHLVRHNFGKVDYEIEPTSLVPKEEPGGQEQPPGAGVPPGQTPGGGGGGGFQDLLGSMSDTAQFSLGNVGSIQMGWDKYNGERGGQGWRNSETGEIRYQEEKPSDSDSEPHEVQESDFVDDVHQVQESDLVKDGQWTDKAIKIGKTILALSNAVPAATSLLVREAGYSEPVQKVALVIATIGDWSVPGLPVGSALVTALTLASSPTLPFKLMKKASTAVSEQIKRMRQKQVKLGLETPNNETILAVGDWLNSAKDFNQSLAIFAEALNQANDVAKALAVAKKVVKTVRLGWEPYEGPKGGKGWHNTETLEVRYQEEKPGGIFEKDEEEEVKKDIKPDADFFDEGGTKFYTKTSNPKEYAARLTDLRKNNVLKRIAKKLGYIELLAEELTEERDKDVDYSGDIEDTVGTLENIGQHISNQLSSIVEAHQKNILEAYKDDQSVFPEEVDTWFEEINDKWNEEIQSTIDMIISAIENQDENTGEHAAYWIEKLNEEIESAFNEISDESYAIVESIEGAIEDAVNDHEIDAQNYTEYLSEESEDPDAEAEKFNREAADNPYQMNRVWFDEDEGEWVYSEMDDLWDDEIDYPGKEADKKNRDIRLSLLVQLAKEYIRLAQPQFQTYQRKDGSTGYKWKTKSGGTRYSKTPPTDRQASSGKDEESQQRKTTPEDMAQRYKSMIESGNVTKESVQEYFDDMLSMTVKNIQTLKKTLGYKASGRKAELAKKIVDQAFAIANKQPEPEPKPQPIDQVEQPEQRSSNLSSLAQQAVSSNSALSPEQKQVYLSTISQVEKSLPQKAMDRVNQNLKGVYFGSNTINMAKNAFESVEQTDSFANLSPEAKQKHEEQKKVILSGKLEVGGTYQFKQGQMYLDGMPTSSRAFEAENEKAEYKITNSEQQLRHIYTHEIAHSIDGPENELSNSDEWQNAWNNEIYYHPFMSIPQLTAYAATSPSEGFAEFCRLVYTDDVPLDEIEIKFPLSSALLKRKALWPNR